MQDETSDSLTWYRRAFPLVAGIVLFGLIVASFIPTRKIAFQQNDFGAYYRAGIAVRAGVSPYRLDEHGPQGAYMYAPAIAHFALRPVAGLSYLWALRVFLVVNWIATFVCVWLCVKLLPASKRYCYLPVVIALVSIGTYFWASIHNGQVGTILLLCCLGWLWLHLNGKPFAGGMLLSIAIGLKLYPVILLPYLVIRRDWRGLIGAAVGGLVLLIGPGIFVGFSHVIPLHQEWLKFCITTQVPTQTYRAGNQSLLAVLARLWFISDGKTLYSSDHLQTLSKIYPVIVAGISAILYGWIFFKSKTRSNIQIIAEVSLLLIWMTLASPRTWTFNLAMEFLPGLMLAIAIVEKHPRRWLAIVALVGVLLAIVFPTNSLPESNHWSLWRAFLLNKHFNAAVLMGVAVMTVRTDAALKIREQP